MTSGIYPFTSYLDDIRNQNPLILNITNYVVMNFTANVLLALGASPVMAHAPEEVEEMTGHARALVVNIGTLSAPWVNSMNKAVGKAGKLGRPWVLDPVGAGATIYRTQVCRELLTTVPPAVIRGNASEICALAGEAPATKGVDSTLAASQAWEAAVALSQNYGCTVVVSGAVDLILDAHRHAWVHNGSPLMARVTGMGCAATAVVGAFLPVAATPWQAALAAMTVMGVAGEMAAISDPGLGSFAVHFLDTLSRLQPELMAGRAYVTTEEKTGL